MPSNTQKGKNSCVTQLFIQEQSGDPTIHPRTAASRNCSSGTAVSRNCSSKNSWVTQLFIQEQLHDCVTQLFIQE
ncbi:hypothetical protein JCGZ_22986 [Jatropha curcas]|uniref:Uncharacterized protein n=1 Tax=Jatropha curcas TaxID=180498 RepID=A0A067K0Y2_JATCU|nr:hypothetical protein JCGZ_22986 [Jatropha curcas]